MQTRKRTRLLSSLYDLKLTKVVSSSLNSLVSIKSQNSMEKQNGRKQKRQMSIKIRKQNNKISENFIKIQKTKTLIEQALIFQSLKNHFIFNALLQQENIIENFVSNFKLCHIKKGWYLISQNDQANFFFILHEGVLSVEVDGRQRTRLYSGKGFGQLALLYSAPRSASVKAIKDSTLWYIDRITFQKCINDIMSKQFQQNLSFIKNIQLFAPLTAKQKNKIASMVITQKFEPHQKVFQSGSRASSMLVVKSGKLKKSVRGYSIQVLKKGDICEQFAVLTKNSSHRQTLIAIQKSQILSFCAENIEKALGKSLPLVVCRNMARQRLMKISYFNCLSTEFLDKIIDTFQIKKVEKHQVVAYTGLHMKNLIFFVIQGIFQISNNNKVSEVYGCQSLQKERRQQKYDFSFHFINEGRIAYSSVQQIEDKLQCSFKDLLQKNNALFNQIQNHKKSVIAERIFLQNCDQNSFIILSSIGSGHFGEVFKVCCKLNDKFYALKVIQKSDLRVSYLNNQKTVLERVINPFVVDYYGYFEDEQKVSFVLEYIEGVQLFTALRSLGLLSLKQSRFYAANIFQAIYSMHKIDIVYRDLKPQNIMLQKSGYLKIIDLGTCKALQSTQRTYTIIGTPSYMAPQILVGKGYSVEVDLWSLGVILFQFLAGYLPFGEQLEDPYQIFQEVLHAKLQFPSYIKDDDVIDLIQRLLNRKPYERLLGCYNTIRNHPFFDDIVWQDLISKSLNPFYRVHKQQSQCQISDNTKKLQNIKKLKTSSIDGFQRFSQ